MAGFRATPSRRNPVLYGMVVYAIRFKNPLLHRQSTLRKRQLGENRVSGQTSRVVGGDTIHRILCKSCPLPTIRIMGDEGTETPIHFFIEGPIGAPDPCFEAKQASKARGNFLPHSPGPIGANQITLNGTGQGFNCELRFSGTAWRVDEIDQLKSGDDVKGSIVYKLQLYWEQEGLCPGCSGRIRFDNMEMDRLVPGSGGGGYTVGNIQLLCPACNRIKGGRDMKYLTERRRSQGLILTKADSALDN